MQIFDIVARWPGSAHDSRIFHNSNVKHRLQNGELEGSGNLCTLGVRRIIFISCSHDKVVRTGILLGDSGYPQLPYLFTPVLDPVMPVRPATAPADPNYLLDIFAYRDELRAYRARMQYNRAHKSTRNIVER